MLTELYVIGTMWRQEDICHFMELLVILGLRFSKQQQLCAASSYYLRSSDVAMRQSQTFCPAHSYLIFLWLVGWVAVVFFEWAENNFFKGSFTNN